MCSEHDYHHVQIRGLYQTVHVCVCVWAGSAVIGATQTSQLQLSRRSAALSRPFAHMLQVAVRIDACRLHCATDVIDGNAETLTLSRIVPAWKTTALQSLDTHVSREFKHALRENVGHARCRADGGDISMLACVGCLWDAMSTVVRRDWSNEFNHNGSEYNQRHVSDDLAMSVCASSAEPIAMNVPPTLTQIGTWLPRSARAAAAIKWRRCLQPPRAQGREIPRVDDISLAMMRADRHTEAVSGRM